MSPKPRFWPIKVDVSLSGSQRPAYQVSRLMTLPWRLSQKSLRMSLVSVWARAGTVRVKNRLRVMRVRRIFLSIWVDYNKIM